MSQAMNHILHRESIVSPLQPCQHKSVGFVFSLCKIIVSVADSGHSDLVVGKGHGMVWKSTTSFYDEVVRVPLILSYPHQVEPGEMDLAFGLTNLMPTLLDFLEYPIPDGIQGHSLAPYLLRKRDPVEAPPYTFCERVQPNQEHSRKVAPGTPASFMIRGKGWKYIVYPDKEEFLYDLKNDPGETKNLADNPSFQDVRVELRDELDAWLVSTEYPGL